MHISVSLPWFQIFKEAIHFAKKTLAFYCNFMSIGYIFLYHSFLLLKLLILLKTGGVVVHHCLCRLVSLFLLLLLWWDCILFTANLSIRLLFILFGAGRTICSDLCQHLSDCLLTSLVCHRVNVFALLLLEWGKEILHRVIHLRFIAWPSSSFILIRCSFRWHYILIWHNHLCILLLGCGWNLVFLLAGNARAFCFLVILCHDNYFFIYFTLNKKHNLW